MGDLAGNPDMCPDQESNCNRIQPKGGPQIGICNGVQKSLEIIGSTPQGQTCLECWQLWPIVEELEMGLQRKIGAGI